MYNSRNLETMNENGGIKMNKENRFQHFNNLKASTIMRCAKQFKSKRDYKVLSVTFTKDKKHDVYKMIEKMPVTFGNNNIAMNCKANNQKVTTLIAGVTSKKEIKNYINNIVLAVLDKNIMDLIKDSYNKTIFMPAKKDDIIIQTEKDKYYSIVQDAYVEFRNSWVEYYTAVYTTTSMKKHGVYFIKKDEKHFSWRDTIEELIPDFYKELTSKAIKNNGKASRETTRAGAVMYKIDALKAIKLFGRPSLAMTSCVRLGDLKGIAIYKETFISEVNGTSASDGSAFFCNEAMAELMNIAPTEAQRLCLQLRSRNARDKFAATGASKEWIDSKVAELKAKGLVRIIGDENNIGVLLDDNCVKLNGDGSLDTDLRLYNIAEPGVGESSIQALTKPAFAAAKTDRLKEFKDYIVSTAKEQLIAEVNDKLSDETKDAKIGSAYHIDVVKQFNATNPILIGSKRTEIQNGIKKRIQKVKFDFGFEFGALVPDRAAMITNGKCELFRHDDEVIEVFYGKYSMKIGNMKRKMEYLRKSLVNAVFDDNGKADDIRAEIEELSIELNNMIDNYSEAVLYKYPSASHVEYLKVKVVDSYELEQRINSFNISDIDRKEILNGVKYGSTGIIMMPNDVDCMSLLAGFDFDFDEAFICFNKKLNSFLPFNRQTIELDKSIDSNVDMLAVDDNLLNEMIAMQLALDDSVGKVTVEFTVITMLLIDMLDGSEEAYKTALHFLNEAFGVKYHKIEKDYYETPKDRVVSPKFVDAIITEIMSVEWTKQNVMKFLLDACFVGRFYQESIIDATKTGEFFVRLINCTTIKLTSRQGLEIVDGIMRRSRCEQLGNFKKIMKTMKRGDEIITTNIVDRQVKYIQYNDVFGRIQDELIEAFNNEIVPIMDTTFDSYSYTKEDVSKMHSVFLGVQNGRCIKNEEGKKVFADSFNKLLEAKTVYNVLVGDRMRMLQIADGDDDEIEEINNDFNSSVAALANNIKDIFAEMEEYAELSSFVKGALLIGISIYDKNEETFVANSKNRFAYSVDLESSIAFLTKSEDNIYRTYGEILYDEEVAKEGDVITLDRGMDINNKIICESTYSGEAIYAKDENGSYLVQERNISDLAKENESDNNILTIAVSDLADKTVIENMYDSIDIDNSKMLLINNNGQYIVRIYTKDGYKDVLVKKLMGLNNTLIYRGGKVSDSALEIVSKDRIIYNENDQDVVKYYSFMLTK